MSLLAPRWRKVVRDIVTNRPRTILVVLSIAAGVFSIGTIATTRIEVQAELQARYDASHPAAAILHLAPFDDALVESVRRMPEVGSAEAFRTVTVQVQVAPEEWKNLTLTVVPDFESQPIDAIAPESGPWPPPEGGFLLERSAKTDLPQSPGSTLTIRTPDGRIRTIEYAGLAYAAGSLPAFYVGNPFGYVTLDTLTSLGYAPTYSELRVLPASADADSKQIADLASAVERRVEDAGGTLIYTRIPVRGQHPAHQVLDSLFLVLTALGILSLIASGFLVVNTVLAVLSQQTRQIGVMKAIGARSGQIAGLYLALVAGYGVLALAVAIPLGALAAYGLTVFTANLVNLDIRDFSVPLPVLGLELGVGLAVPLLGSIIPIAASVRMSVREAIASTGLSTSFGESPIDRFLRRMRGLPRPVLLSLRNTFRRRARLSLTLSALILGGAIFMAIFTVRASLYRTLDNALSFFSFDVQVNLVQPTRTPILEAEGMAVKGVTSVEGWMVESMQRVRTDESLSQQYVVFGLPSDTQSVDPTLERGRWLLPGDENAAVVTANVLDDESDVDVGSTITLRSGGFDHTWKIVGVVNAPTQRPAVYVPRAYLQEISGSVGRSTIVFVRTQAHDADSVQASATAIRRHYESLGIQVSSTTTDADVRTQQTRLFEILVSFLTLMASLLGVVGAIGLAGTMTMNVAERAREIGVMRAIGASDGGVRRVFLVEGLVIGVLSWAASIFVSIPVAKLMSDALGLLFIKRPLDFAFSPEGIFVWLVVVVILSIAASALPAARASRIPVREVLAYE